MVNGFLLEVDSNFVRRGKNHILDFADYGGVSCILGTNGYIWIQPSTQLGLAASSNVKTVSEELRLRMSALRNAIVALEKAQIPIFRDTIQSVLDFQIKRAMSPKDMLK